MSDYAMPWAVVNMGSEMLYILEQRLQAQNIADEKANRVLSDVISTMFSEKFMTELFKSQRMYSSNSTRQIFDKLAHSSIMRLNTTSMDKLYDLMTMACKYQLLLVASPTDLAQVCYNHIDVLRKFCNSTETKQLVEKANEQLQNLFAKFTVADYILLKQTLARFFQDRRVKVSLFLQDGLQTSDGNIVMSYKGAAGAGVSVPGAIRYYAGGKVTREDHVTLKNADGVQLHKGDKTELGTNMYAKDKRKKGKTVTSTTVKKVEKEKEALKADPESAKSATSELNLLADLIGHGAATKDKIDILSLFPSAQLTDEKGQRVESDVLTFDAEDADARVQELQKRLAELEVCDEQEDAGEEEDLLDLMDRA